MCDRPIEDRERAPKMKERSLLSKASVRSAMNIQIDLPFRFESDRLLWTVETLSGRLPKSWGLSICGSLATPN